MLLPLTPDLYRRIVECFFVSLTALASITCLALNAGYSAWTWDALNHHVYLGLVADSPRWHLDVSAAASQTYQYPYLYWPAYRLSLVSGSGATASAFLMGIQTALVVPPVWLLSYRLIPDGGTPWLSRGLRLFACMFALISLPVLASLGTTANDVLAGVPVLWAIALTIGYPGSRRAALAGATLLGVSIAFKYSNVLFLPLLFFAWWQPDSRELRGLQRLPIKHGFAIGLVTASGFIVAYAPWGWQLWRVTGNPFYPHFSQFLGG